MLAKDSGLFIPRAVIFDWDGTLIDSWGAITEATNFVRAKYGLSVMSHEESMLNSRRSARELFPEWFGDNWQTPHKELYIKFNEIREREGLHIVAGSSDLIGWLKEKNIPLMVVSNKHGRELRHEVEKLGWKHYFKSVVGAGDAARDKPAREHADMALNLAGLEASADILFIGDSESDIACARNTGCTPYLVGTKEKAQELDVALFAEDCAEILARLQSL